MQLCLDPMNALKDYIKKQKKQKQNPNVFIFFCRDISKNSLLSFRTFLYWTVLGFCHAFVFFFGSYILMGEDTTLMGNGQVCVFMLYDADISQMLVQSKNEKSSKQILSSNRSWLHLVVLRTLTGLFTRWYFCTHVFPSSCTFLICLFVVLFV